MQQLATYYVAIVTKTSELHYMYTLVLSHYTISYIWNINTVFMATGIILQQ